MVHQVIPEGCHHGLLSERTYRGDPHHIGAGADLRTENYGGPTPVLADDAPANPLIS